jgi:hypothetical protein
MGGMGRSQGGSCPSHNQSLAMSDSDSDREVEAVEEIIDALTVSNFEEAIEALTEEDIEACRNISAPSTGLQLVFKGISIMFNITPDRKEVDGVEVEDCLTAVMRKIPNLSTFKEKLFEVCPSGGYKLRAVMSCRDFILGEDEEGYRLGQVLIGVIQEIQKNEAQFERALKRQNEAIQKQIDTVEKEIEAMRAAGDEEEVASLIAYGERLKKQMEMATAELKEEFMIE